MLLLWASIILTLTRGEGIKGRMEGGKKEGSTTFAIANVNYIANILQDI